MLFFFFLQIFFFTRLSTLVTATRWSSGSYCHRRHCRHRDAENIPHQKQAAPAAAKTAGKPKRKRARIRRPVGAIASKLSRPSSRAVTVSTTTSGQTSVASFAAGETAAATTTSASTTATKVSTTGRTATTGSSEDTAR